VIPAQAGIAPLSLSKGDSRLRGNDGPKKIWLKVVSLEEMGYTPSIGDEEITS
jgi:hypothetical protein